MKAACLSLLLACVGCDAAPDRLPPWDTNAIIDQAVIPHVEGRVEETRVLAWHSEGYVESPRGTVECVLVWVALKPGGSNNYALVKATRNPANGPAWAPELIPHGEFPIRYFSIPPTSAEVVAFTKEWFGPARAGARLNDSSILRHNWKRSTGEYPTVTYK